MHEWSRIPCQIDGVRRADDWIILHNGQPVGRVMLDRFPYNEAQPWVWHKQIGRGVNGREDSLEEALEALRRAVKTGL